MEECAFLNTGILIPMDFNSHYSSNFISLCRGHAMICLRRANGPGLHYPTGDNRHRYESSRVKLITIARN